MGLTRTYNKKFFLDRLEDRVLVLRKRHRTMLSLVMFDVDHFKRINDTYGHLAGDAVLVLLARTAQSTVRHEDVLARYGGEEFAVICRGIPLLNAGVFAERHAHGGRADFTSSMAAYRLPVNISVRRHRSTRSQRETRRKSSSRHCDEALYEAKRSGRNRVCIRGL